MIPGWTQDSGIRRPGAPGARRWLAFMVLAWLMALYSVQLAASVHPPDHAQPHQKWQMERHGGAELLRPEAPQAPDLRRAFRLPLSCPAVVRPGFDFHSRPRCRAPPRHSSPV